MVGSAVLGQQLDLMILKASSSQNDSMILMKSNAKFYSPYAEQSPLTHRIKKTPNNLTVASKIIVHGSHH